MLIPILLNGCEVKPLMRYKLQTKTNKAAGISANAPWYLSNRQIMTELTLRTLDDLIYEKKGKQQKKFNGIIMHLSDY